MKRWTPEAEQRLDDYLNEVLALARWNGEGEEDFVEELRVHIRNDAEEGAGGVVTPQVLERALAAAGRPHDVLGVEAPQGGSSPAPRNGSGAKATAREEARYPKGLADLQVSEAVPPLPRKAIVFCGVVLPVIAIGMEFFLISATGGGGVGVLPTMWHAGMIAGVPLINLVLLLWADAHADLSRARDRRAIGLALGYLIGVSAAYTLLMLPLLPFSAVAVLYFGLGLIGFSPALSWWSAGLTANAFRKRGLFERTGGVHGRRWLLAGAALAVAALAGYWGLQELRRHHARTVLAGEPEAQGRSLRWLDVIGAPDPSSAWMRTNGIGDIWTNLLTGEPAFRTRLRASELEQVVFRVTGEAPEPGDGGSPWRTANLFSQRWQILNDQGRDEVGRMIPGLSLAGSTMSVDLTGDGLGEAGLSYTEWILVFSNDNPQVNEARCIIAMPPGSVASRLTLWINGIECEAAFGGASQVKAAYQDVAIVRRQDPALLTNSARGENFLQCFPVPAFGTMKVKVGITAPLESVNGKVFLALPRLAGENFTVPEHFEHEVQVESARGMRSGHTELRAIKQDNGGFSLVGSLPHEDWIREPAVAEVAIAGSLPLGVFEGALGPYRATMEVAPAAPKSGRDVWLVVDGSAGVGRARVDWSKLVKAFPEDTRLHAVFAHFTPEEWDESGGADGLAAWIASREFGFGQRFAPALHVALRRAAGTENSEVIAIHGPQPFEDGASESVLASLRAARRNGYVIPVRLVAAAAGPNMLARALVTAGEVEAIGHGADVQERLELIARLGVSSDVSRRYTFTEDSEAAEGALRHGESSHVVRMAALDQVMRLLRSASPAETQEAIAIGRRCRLVTPVTGAVVLENQDQYKRHGLDDSEAMDAVPAVPEPEEWLLMGVAAFALCLAWIRRRRLHAARAC